MSQPTSIEHEHDFRDELFGVGECEEPPFWICVKKTDGSERTDAEALAVVEGYCHAEPGLAWRASRVSMYLVMNEYGEFGVRYEEEDGALGRFEFWMVDES